jgi:metalloendopeptidase OMA1, mitochondrial
MGTGMPVPQHAQQPPIRYKAFPGRFPNRGPLLIHAWKTKPGFRYAVYSIGGIMVVFYVSNLEKVPVTGRWRFNCISSESEAEASEEMYQQILQQYQGRVYGNLHPYTRKVRRVLDRLIAVSALEDMDWEVHVIADPDQKNAFVIPG